MNDNDILDMPVYLYDGYIMQKYDTITIRLD